MSPFDAAVESNFSSAKVTLLLTIATIASQKFATSLFSLACPFCIMLLYQYLLHCGLLLHVMSQYLWLFSLILRGLSWRGRMPAAGILGRKRSKYWKPILYSSKSPETPWKSFLKLMIIIERKKYQRGPTVRVKTGGSRVGGPNMCV